MSRSGYDDNYGGWDLIMYRGAVASAIRGNRGQQLLRELLTALDAMPAKVLIAHELEVAGAHCALGVVGTARGLRMDNIDASEPDEVARVFNIAESMAREIVFVNDEGGPYHQNESPEARWTRVRAWVVRNIKAAESEAVPA